MLKLKLQYFGHLMRRVDSLERPWCWEALGAGGGRDDRGWDGWMASPTQCTIVWVNSGSWWWTGRPGVLWFMGSQRVGHNWVAELNWTTSWDLKTRIQKALCVFQSWVENSGEAYESDKTERLNWLTDWLTYEINSQRWDCLINGLTEFLIWIHIAKFPFNECHFTLTPEGMRIYASQRFAEQWHYQTSSFSNMICKNEISMIYDFFLIFFTISETNHLLLCISFCFVNCLDMSFLYFSICLFPF